MTDSSVWLLNRIHGLIDWYVDGSSWEKLINCFINFLTTVLSSVYQLFASIYVSSIYDLLLSPPMSLETCLPFVMMLQNLVYHFQDSSLYLYIIISSIFDSFEYNYINIIQYLKSQPPLPFCTARHVCQTYHHSSDEKAQWKPLFTKEPP